MAAEKEIVVAIEFGSSMIRGIAGCRNIDGSIQILDVVNENAKNCIRKGIIYNIDKTVLCLKTIVEKLEQDLNVHINKVFVGIGGKSLRTMKNSVSRQLETKVIVSNELVNSLLETNKETSYADYEILDVVPQEYRVGADLIMDPVGILSNQIEGRYLNVIAKSCVKEYIYTCLRTAGLEPVGYFISPMALAENVLTDTEKRSGCVLVDFGMDTTTIAIYKNNVLRHLAVLPLGSHNITQDIAALQVEADEAEELKLKYGSAFSELKSEDLVKNILINNERTIEERVLVEIVEARMEEILGNVWEQICNSGYRDKLIAGMVVTGGGANIKNIDKAIANRTGLDKIRFVRIVQAPLQAIHTEQVVKDGTMNTLISLLSLGNQDCTTVKEDKGPTAEEVEAAALRQKQEEEKRLAAALEAEREKEAERLRLAEEEKKRKKAKKTSFFSILRKKISDISKNIVEEE